MALYRYFSIKDELVDALLNRVLGRMEPPSDSASWIEDLGGFARNHRDMLSRHRWAVTALFAHPVPGPNALPIGEWALRILARGGITGDAAKATFSGNPWPELRLGVVRRGAGRRCGGVACRGSRRSGRGTGVPPHRLRGRADEPLWQRGARAGARPAARRDPRRHSLRSTRYSGVHYGRPSFTYALAPHPLDRHAG